MAHMTKVVHVFIVQERAWNRKTQAEDQSLCWQCKYPQQTLRQRWASTRDSNKDLAWKQDPCPLEQQRSATILPWEQKREGEKDYFKRKLNTVKKAKKGTECYNAWWHKSFSKSNYNFVLFLNKITWHVLSKFAASVGTTNSLCPYVFPTHKNKIILLIYPIIIIFTVTLSNILIPSVY